MVNFNNGKIYKLISNLSDKMYIGSTCQSLPRRKAKHKNDYKRYLEGKANYMTSYELIKLGNIDIILLESFSCSNKEELYKKERYYIENTENCINKVRPSITIEDKEDYYKNYKEVNKDKINKRQKIYNEEHKDKINEYQKVYREMKRDIINQKQREYNKLKKEEISLKKKLYYEANKEAIKLKTKERRDSNASLMKIVI
jgi:hypothetical protein